MDHVYQNKGQIWWMNLAAGVLISQRGATGGISQQAEHKGIYMEILRVHT